MTLTFLFAHVLRVRLISLTILNSELHSRFPVGSPVNLHIMFNKSCAIFVVQLINRGSVTSSVYLQFWWSCIKVSPLLMEKGAILHQFDALVYKSPSGQTIKLKAVGFFPPSSKDFFFPLHIFAYLCVFPYLCLCFLLWYKAPHRRMSMLSLCISLILLGSAFALFFLFASLSSYQPSNCVLPDWLQADSRAAVQYNVCDARACARADCSVTLM